MTLRNDFIEAIAQRFVAELPDPEITYVLPGQSTEDAMGKAEWLHLQVAHSSERLVALRKQGAHRYQKSGHIYVRSYTKINSGTERGDALAWGCEQMFRGRSLEGFVCTFSNVHTRELGRDPTGRYEVLLTDAFFAYRHTG